MCLLPTNSAQTVFNILHCNDNGGHPQTRPKCNDNAVVFILLFRVWSCVGIGAQPKLVL